MTFPIVVARTSSEQASDANSFTVSLGGPSAGELLVAVIAVDGNDQWTIDESTSGKNWYVAAHVTSTNSVVGIVAIKVADGSDALRLISQSGTQQASSIVFRISGHGSYAAVASTTGSGTNGDPPNGAITGAGQDCLFLTGLCTDAQVVASSAPASYGNLTTKVATTSGGASVSVADRNLNASSDNPGTFTNASEQWVAFTIAIPENNITTHARTTQAAVESVSQVDPNLVATQIALEVMSANSLNMIVTQVALETLTPQTQNMYATQVALEVLSGDPWPSLSNPNKYRQIQIAC